ncbi:hypothetical protein ACIQSP_16490 [Streptomyces nigra]|uniref:hypothetical protein n=1 Tax=Streptomyces nigra TaxID=1827580 RepID=UPI0037F98486
MTYFSLRKPDPEPEPEEVEEEQPEDAEDEPAEKAPAAPSNPIAAGLTGPGRWIAAHFGMGTALGVHLVAVWAVAYYGGWVAIGIVLVWLLAVGLFVPREFLDRLSAAVEHRLHRGTPAPQEQSPPATREAQREAVVRLLDGLIGEGRGVHLRTVLAHLQEHGQWEGKSVADLRVHLEALGIPVSPKVKVGGVPTRGVLRADLDALSRPEEMPASPAPSPPV